MMHAICRVVRLGFTVAAVGVLAAATALPASADYRRSCHFVVEVTPEDSGQNPVIYSFRVFTQVPHLSGANDYRRRLRARITECVQSHWANRDASSPPEACTRLTFYEMQQYPFSAMGQQIRDDTCAANRDELRMNVDIELFIRGQRGCIERDEERGVVDPAGYVMIAPGFRVNCPIPEGGGWEMGGAPATPPLPDVRLPGRDLPNGIRQIGNDWKECWRLCEATNACGAWTFREPGTWQGTSSAVCLLKSGAGRQVHDTCCSSGIKN